MPYAAGVHEAEAVQSDAAAQWACVQGAPPNKTLEPRRYNSINETPGQ